MQLVTGNVTLPALHSPSFGPNQSAIMMPAAAFFRVTASAHLQAGDDWEAPHELRNQAVLDEVGLLHLTKHIGGHLCLAAAQHLGSAATMQISCS